jgi:FMN-dependent NADH-azoreductase
MKILRVSCSPRGEASESYRLSQSIIGQLLRSDPTAEIVGRFVGHGEIPSVDESYAVSQQSAQDVSQEGTACRSEELIRELEISDIVVIATPVHNYTVPSALKTWIDHIVRVRRTFNITANGKVGTLRDRPVFVAVSSGGRYSGVRARQPDFLTPYLEAILGMIGLHDLTFFSVEGTAFGADAVAETRAATDEKVRNYFASFASRSTGVDEVSSRRAPEDS